MDWDDGSVDGFSFGAVVQKILQPLRASRTHRYIHGNNGAALRERKQYTLYVDLYSDSNQYGHADFDENRHLHRHDYLDLNANQYAGHKCNNIRRFWVTRVNQWNGNCGVILFARGCCG
jgi:hypothetical protein